MIGGPPVVETEDVVAALLEGADVGCGELANGSAGSTILELLLEGLVETADVASVDVEWGLVVAAPSPQATAKHAALPTDH